MELKLYDTLTREKRVFTPIDPARVRMYVCGPTVYDFAHIGNARPVIVFDVLYRLLQHLAKQGVWDGGKGETAVTYVRNITDVDDKINDRAARDYPDLPLNEAIRKVTEQTEKQFHNDVDALGCLRPTFEPRATEYINRIDAPMDMVRLIGLLINNRNAYPAEGHVLFDISTMPDYGRLVKQPLNEMLAGARVDPAPFKRNPMDFVLWKPSKLGEPSWPSPWGNGRPGWHIECSAMSAALLGKTFDIHGGGIDLLFPHHENEIAQSCCAFHTSAMANYWVHNGFLQVEGEKMSKSLGNFFTIRDLLKKWPGDVLRLQMLMTNYRQPIDWTEKSSYLANQELEDWASALHGYFNFKNDHKPNEVADALCDDLNTPAAISLLRELFVVAEKGGHTEKLKFAANCRLLGFKNLDKPGLFRFGVSGINVGAARLADHEETIQALRAAIANSAPDFVHEELKSDIRKAGLDVDINNSGDITLIKGNREVAEKKINELVAARTAARADKNFKESDRIRDELAAMGVVLKDSKDGTTWEIAR